LKGSAKLNALAKRQPRFQKEEWPWRKGEERYSTTTLFSGDTTRVAQMSGNCAAGGVKLVV